MKNMNRVFLILISTLTLGANSSWALNTTQAWVKGFSDYEAYYGNIAGKTHGLFGTFGYGAGELVNVGLNWGLSNDKGRPYYVGLSNFSNVYQGTIEWDLIPYFNYSKSIWSLGLGSEMTLPMGATTPYFKVDLSQNYVTVLNQRASVFSYWMGLGVAHKFYDTGRTFLQAGYGGSYSVAVGHNFDLTKDLVLLVDATYDFSKVFSGSIGVIYTLQ